MIPGESKEALLVFGEQIAQISMRLHTDADATLRLFELIIDSILESGPRP